MYGFPSSPNPLSTTAHFIILMMLYEIEKFFISLRKSHYVCVCAVHVLICQRKTNSWLRLCNHRMVKMFVIMKVFRIMIAPRVPRAGRKKGEKILPSGQYHKTETDCCCVRDRRTQVLMPENDRLRPHQTTKTWPRLGLKYVQRRPSNPFMLRKFGSSVMKFNNDRGSGGTERKKGTRELYCVMEDTICLLSC